MKNKELFDIYSGLVAVDKFGNARFSYGVSKNKKIILEEIKILEETIAYTDKYKEYDTKRIELCKEMSHKDEAGNAKTKNNGSEYDIIDQEEFEKKLEELKEEYKEEITIREAKMEEYKDLLEAESTVELFKIKLDIVPDEVKSNLMDPIFDVIEFV